MTLYCYYLFILYIATNYITALITYYCQCYFVDFLLIFFITQATLLAGERHKRQEIKKKKKRSQNAVPTKKDTKEPGHVIN